MLMWLQRKPVSALLPKESVLKSWLGQDNISLSEIEISSFIQVCKILDAVSSLLFQPMLLEKEYLQTDIWKVWKKIL